MSFMNSFHSLLTLIGMSLAALTLGACGVKSSPQDPIDSTYPQHYPATEKSAPVITGSDKPAEPVRSGAGSAEGIYQYPNSPSYLPPGR